MKRKKRIVDQWKDEDYEYRLIRAGEQEGYFGMVPQYKLLERCVLIKENFRDEPLTPLWAASRLQNDKDILMRRLAVLKESKDVH